MARDKKREHDDDTPDVYFIPPNFMQFGGLGGMFKIRNGIEAAIIAVPLAFLMWNVTSGMSIDVRLPVIVLVTLPPAALALFGLMGLSFGQFLLLFIKFLFKRKIIGREAFYQAASDEADWERYWDGEDEPPPPSRFATLISRIFRGKQAKLKSLQIDPVKRNKGKIVRIGFGKYMQSSHEAAVYLPIRKIKNGIIHTTDNRYVKILEVTPINFRMRTPREQRSIIWSYVSFLKIAPMKVQLKCVSKKADIERIIRGAKDDLGREANEKCRELQSDYINLLYDIGTKEAVSRRFFLVFEYEPYQRARDVEIDARNQLDGAANTARSYLAQCGNEIIQHDNQDDFTLDVLYQLLNRRTSVDTSLAQRKRDVVMDYAQTYGKINIDEINQMEYCAPKYIDLSHINYMKIDGQYVTYLMVTQKGYKEHVTAGWLSLFVNAGEGIDVDIFHSRESKEKVQMSVRQVMRLNKTRTRGIDETSGNYDTLGESIGAGRYIKDGMSNGEDFYYTNMLITITGPTRDVLDYLVREMKKRLVAQDVDVVKCSLRMEEAFLSSLPLNMLDKNLKEWTKRNMLTSGVASCYPLTSYEMCDDNGILLGINKQNRSLIMVDIFNSKVYKNANMAIMGTTGAGKSFTMQLIATRMRRKGIQVFILAPLKGHEFYRTCSSIGGSFITISPSSNNCINIMEIRSIDTAAAELIDGDIALERSLMTSKIMQLHIFFSLLIPDMNYEEKQLLDEAIVCTYHKFGIFHENESLRIDPDDPNSKFKQMPILGDLHAVLMERDETKRLGNIINRLVSGSASRFNQHTNVNLENRYVVLDISELKGDLLTIGMFIALDYVWDKTRQDRTKEKAIFLDETWKLIGASSNRMAAEFVLELFKTIRGYGGSAICATQDLNDFFALDEGKYGKGIINACKTKIVLNLEDEEADRVQDILNLSEYERQEIVHFERGNALISANKNNIAVEVRASEKEKELITTDRKELEAIANRRAEERDQAQLLADVEAITSTKHHVS